MSRLTIARDDQIDAIYRESHALWGSGLGFDDYRELWRDLARTAWGGKHTQFCVWVDGRGAVLSSLKLYRPQLRWQGRTGRVTVLGAVFTPTALRGRGHASDMVRAVIRQARERGDRLVLLFSDIGTSYYAALGFLPLPAEEDWGTLPRNPRPPAGWTLRPLDDETLPQTYGAHLDYCMGRPFTMIRDDEHWRFLHVRSARFFERLQDERLRFRQQVGLHEGQFAGYLLTIEGRGEWNVREVGAVGGDAATMVAILRVGAAEARSSGLRGFYGWLPPEVRPSLRDWKMRSRERRQAVPMILPLEEAADLSGLAAPGAAYLPFQDQF